MLYVASSVVVILAVGLALQTPLALPVILVAVLFVLLAVRFPNILSPLLLLAAVPFLRPNLLSNNYALVGTALILLGAVIAVAADRLSTRISRAYGLVAIGVLAMSCSQLASAAAFNVGSVSDVWKGFATTVLTVAAAGVILGDAQRRRFVARVFVGAVVAIGASYIVTVMIWRILGVGALTIGSVEINDGAIATVVAPFTVTFGSLDVFGTSVPRLTGIGREPGWMALYAGIALLLMPSVTRVRWWKLLCLGAALLGTISTGGFGAFVVVVMVVWLVRRGRGDLFVSYVGFLVKLALLAGGIWVAVFAPIVGFAAKGDLNAESLSDRSSSTQAGIDAITAHPFGGVVETSQTAINLVAAIAPFGIQFFLITTAAILLPMVLPRARGAFAVAGLAYLTFLLSQPAPAATFVFLLVGLAYWLAEDRQTTESPLEVPKELKGASPPRTSFRT
jgi:hypothetical protein